MNKFLLAKMFARSRSIERGWKDLVCLYYFSVIVTTTRLSMVLFQGNKQTHQQVNNSHCKDDWKEGDGSEANEALNH